MRVLVHLPYPGYLRLYGSTVLALARRGNEVLLSYDAEKQRSPAAVEIEAAAGVSLIAPIPRREGPLAELTSRLRLGADYLRYLDPDFEEAPWLRERMERFLPAELGFLRDAPLFSSETAKTVLEYLRVLEQSVPSDPAIDDYLASLSPDCIVVSPVLARGRSGVHQRDSVKSAVALGIPVGAAIASWDHLTSKGVLGVVPDVVFVWNKAQRAELMKLHGVGSERIVVTGAQLFDQWFARTPTITREAFARDVGLDPGLPYVLYVGSSPNISPVEQERATVRRWAEALRDSPDPELRRAGVLIRPHPGNVAGWAEERLDGIENVAVFPRERPDIVMSEQEELAYFHSLRFSAAVAGVNTSAMIEAAIVGRLVHTFRTPEFRATQEGTLHFHLLTASGESCVRVADDLSEHLGQLAQALRDPEAGRAETLAFVSSFVRPVGMERPATRVLAKAIERLGASSSRPSARREPARAASGAVGLPARGPGAPSAGSRDGS